MRFSFSSYAALLLAGAALSVAACDAGITGTAEDNRPPDTRLSVRDSSLVDNIGEEGRLSSSVLVSWSGTDPDGYVEAYEVRYFVEGQAPGGGEGWTRTTRSDSLILLPIPPGQSNANVTVEVRAIDNEGLSDPDPAVTVFPIRNSPPALRLSSLELPPDTTFPVFSFRLTATDPEGPANLRNIEIALNDSAQFTALPPDTEFLTLVGSFERGEAGPDVVPASVYTGLAFRRTDVQVPGLRLDAANTLYVRAVDQTGAASPLRTVEVYVTRPTGEVLFVNDYRASTNSRIISYHQELLQDYLPAGTAFDVWDLSRPYTTGSAGGAGRSEALPAVSDPTLRQIFAQWDHIYWVTNNATLAAAGYNLPYAAPALDLFFEQGGTMMVHTPVALPSSAEEAQQNPAVALLPLTRLITIPDTLRPGLRLSSTVEVNPVNAVPGTSEPLPVLDVQRTQISLVPYDASGTSVISLYEADFRYFTSGSPSRQGIWPGASTVASISADRRIGLFSIPLIDAATGDPIITGTVDNPEGARQAVFLMLEGLGFPR